MGGSRCSYQQCANSTSRSPGMRFFHYPAYDKDRCMAWLRQAGTEDFQDLPPKHLRNKVVCREHFTPESFMNYKQDRLTKRAVPTLPQGLVKSEPSNVPVTRTTTTTPTTPADIDFLLPPILKKTNSLVRVFPPKSKIVPQHPVDKPLKKAESSMYMDSSPDVHGQCGRSTEPEEVPLRITKEKTVEEDNNLLNNYGKMIREVRDDVRDLVGLMKERDTRPERIGSSLNGNKRKLYNSIKRHLSPSMATLLGMELFASADHEWQADEKELAVDLFAQGVSVYKYFRDHFRVRLPAIADVERWKVEGDTGRG